MNIKEIVKSIKMHYVLASAKFDTTIIDCEAEKWDLLRDDVVFGIVSNSLNKENININWVMLDSKNRKKYLMVSGKSKAILEPKDIVELT